MPGSFTGRSTTMSWYRPSESPDKSASVGCISLVMAFSGKSRMRDGAASHMGPGAQEPMAMLRRERS